MDTPTPDLLNSVDQELVAMSPAELVADSAPPMAVASKCRGTQRLDVHERDAFCAGFYFGLKVGGCPVEGYPNVRTIA